MPLLWSLPRLPFDPVGLMSPLLRLKGVYKFHQIRKTRHQIRRAAYVEKVDFLEELLLVVLELADHGCETTTESEQETVVAVESKAENAGVYQKLG